MLDIIISGVDVKGNGNVSKLDKFWSPGPIYAVKRYVGLYAWPETYQSKVKPGEPFKLGEWYKAECRSSTPCDDPPALAHYHAPNMFFPCPPKVSPSVPLCGFYGWKRFARIEDGEFWYHSQVERPNMLVEFKGRVIEHEKGYRAEYQRIVRELDPGEIKSGRIPELGEV